MPYLQNRDFYELSRLVPHKLLEAKKILIPKDPVFLPLRFTKPKLTNSKNRRVFGAKLL